MVSELGKDRGCGCGHSKYFHLVKDSASTGCVITGCTCIEYKPWGLEYKSILLRVLDVVGYVTVMTFICGIKSLMFVETALSWFKIKLCGK